MTYNIRLFVILFSFTFANAANAQDRIYVGTGRVIVCKVIEVGPEGVKYADSTDGLEHTLKFYKIDSIIYGNGDFEPIFPRPEFKQPVIKTGPRYNTTYFAAYAFGLGAGYERQLKPHKISLVVPAYLGYLGGSLAGNGTFNRRFGAKVIRDVNYYNFTNSYLISNGGGASFSAGIGPRFYFGKGQKLHAFIEPEFTLGITEAEIDGRYQIYDIGIQESRSFALAAFMCLAGLSYNPLSKINLSVIGGLGLGDVFGRPNPVELTGLWRFGVLIGGNY
jgi:hypothetical protein